MVKQVGVLTVVVCLLAPCEGTGAFEPKAGWTKVMLRRAAPSKLVPGRIHDGTEAILIHEYVEASVLYVRRDELPEIARRAAAQKLDVTLRDDFDVLQLPNGWIDVRQGAEASLPGKRLGPPAQAGTPGLYLLQFAGPIVKAWTDAVTSSGVMLVQYVPMNGYIVAARPEEMAEVSKLPFVQFVDVFHAVLKSQAAGRTKGVRTELLISVANVPDLGKTLRNLDRLSVDGISSEIVGETREELRVRGTFDGEAVDDVVDERLVIAVSEVPRIVVSDERAALSLGPYVDGQGNVLTTGGRYKSWLDAICPACAMLKQNGFYAGVADTGFWAGPKNASNANDPGPDDLPNDHGGGSGRVTYGSDFMTTPPTTLANATATSFDDDPQGSTVGGGHGTFVTTTLAGSGTSTVDPAGFAYGMGVAPSAGIKVTKINFATATSIFSLAHDARGMSPIAYVQNLSLNQYAGPNNVCENPDGRYTIHSRDFDLAARDSNGNPSDGMTPILLVVPAGNQHQSGANPNCPGTGSPLSLTAPPATAKNVLAVGATETPRASAQLWNCRGTNAGSDGLMNVELDSKRGTADSGWFKPDLMTPAANVAALRDDSTTQTALCGEFNSSSTLPPSSYAIGCGTSFAAPVGTGAALLASRAYSATAGVASPALLKAMLVMGARSMKGGKDYGDRDQYGLPKNPVTTIGAIPSQSQGFGRLHMEAILDPYPARVYVNEGPAATLAGVSSSWNETYKVHDATKAVVVVLTWTDAVGQVSEGEFLTNPIVNDLDLTVLRGAPCTNRHVGNLVSSATEESTSVACTGSTTFDRKNNIEIVRFSGAPAGSSFTVTVTYETSNGTSGGDSQPFALAVWNAYASSGDAPPVAPTGVTATATSSSTITVTWASVSGATGYDVRMWNGGPFWQTVATNHASTSFPAAGLAPLTTYVFDVRSWNPAGVSLPSAPDAATTFPTGGSTLFTDDPLVAATTVVKALHITELRNAVNAFRAAAGLPAGTFTDSPLVTGATVKASHVTELRTMLDSARAALNLAALAYTDPTLTGAAVKAAHVQELRNAVK